MSYTRPPRLEPEYRRGGIRPRSPSEMLEPSRPPAPPRKGKGRARPTAVGPFVRFGSTLFTLALALMLAGLGLAALLYHEFERPGPLEIARTVVVPEGLSSNEISELLEKDGIIANRWPFMIGFLAESRIGPKKKVLKHGEYLIKPHASIREIVDVLSEGKAVQYKVTIPEGLTSQQIVERLKAEENLTGDIAAVPPEGSLYPETYGIEKGMTRAALLERMKEKMQQFLAAAWEKRKPGLLLKTPQEAVVFASIVEKETGRGEERPRIAQVFINRLKLPTFSPKLLQTDPTIIYGCTVAMPRSEACQRWDGRIRRIQLEDRGNPYNTYTHEGLPPGPIANPGRAALEAVMEPDRTPYLYFVSKNDGTHYFSRTVAEHEAAVTRYQRTPRTATP